MSKMTFLPFLIMSWWPSFSSTLFLYFCPPPLHPLLLLCDCKLSLPFLTLHLLRSPLTPSISFVWAKICRVLQGDPLFSLSFTLVADGLNRLVKKETKEGLIEGLHTSKNISIINLQYADDTILFGRPCLK